MYSNNIDLTPEIREDAPPAAIRNRYLDYGYPPQSIPAASFDRRNSLEENRNRGSSQEKLREEGEEGVLLFKNCMLKPPKNKGFVCNRLSNPPKECKTITITGLPAGLHSMKERVEGMFRDIFTTNGGYLDFCRLRSGRNCACDVRFHRTESVKFALLVDGYEMVSRDALNPIIRCNIDITYLLYHKDQKEYEEQQLVAKRLELKPGILPDIIPFNEKNADILVNKLKESVGPEVMSHLLVIRTWVATDAIAGDRNLWKFFDILNALSDRVTMVAAKKNDLYRDMKETRAKYQDSFDFLSNQSDQVVSAFRYTIKPKCSECLSGEENRMIDSWFSEATHLQENVTSIREEADQVHAARQNMEAELFQKEEVIAEQDAILQSQKKKIADLEQEMVNASRKSRKEDKILNDKRRELEEMKCAEQRKVEKTEMRLGKRRHLNYGMEVRSAQVDDVEARILCSVSSVIRCYPHGATVQELEQYLDSQKVMFEPGDVDMVLSKFPQLFCIERVNADGKSVKKWSMSPF